ncbi:hypothetical protein GQ457_05G011410 [Hibiscus cannabinus]
MSGGASLQANNRYLFKREDEEIICVLSFCSDGPLSFTAPSGQETWSFYKVMIPVSKVGIAKAVVIMRENPSEKYIQMVTVDGHDFWFIGFLNYEKASV